MNKFFNATSKAALVGDGTVGALVTWLEKFVNVLFPDNGIEYWAQSSKQGSDNFLKADDRLPGVGAAEDCLHHIACYVRPGSCEGRIIEVLLSLRNGHFKSLTWVKTFGGADECWLIARALDEALNALFFWQELPELVAMSDKLPRQYNWHRQTSLTEEVEILSAPDRVRVSTATGLVFDEREWEGQASAATAVVQDWVTVLTNTNAKFKLVKDTADRLNVPDLPGFVISKRGVDVEGYYVLPPGANANDDRCYLGYFPSAADAIEAARKHQGQLVLVEKHGVTIAFPRSVAEALARLLFLKRPQHPAGKYFLSEGVGFKSCSRALLQMKQTTTFDGPATSLLAEIELALDACDVGMSLAFPEAQAA